MSRTNLTFTALVALVAFAAASPAHAVMRITEWMYSGSTGEFIEFTNVGPAVVDMTGWTYDDDSRDFVNGFDLSAFGVIAAGETVIITEDSAATFRINWSLDASVKVLGGYTNNIGRNDEINLYDNLDQLVDRLTYGDQSFPGSFRTQGTSANIDLANLGDNDPVAAVASFIGDAFGSYANSAGDLGNPGTYSPEPASAAFLAAGALLALGHRRRNA